MSRQLLSTFLFFALGLLSLGAQTPRNIVVQGTKGEPTLQTRGLCNEAGTIRFGPHFGQSSDVSPDTIYLCFGDSLQIFHNRDADLSGDPNPATLPGIGYGFYDCRPTEPFSGPNLATIKQDPCLNRTSPIILNGTPIPQTDSIWIATGRNAAGDITLFNNGLLQSAFNNGLPIQFWFAPITLDDIADAGFEFIPPDGEAGPCVDVNHEAAFSVVYLNPIQITDKNVMAGPNGCTGSFVVGGGLPQFDPQSDYRIFITLRDNPEVRAIIRGTPFPNPGDTLEFFVPQPGIYDIEISDGKSCSLLDSMDMSNCEAVSMELPFRNAAPGSNICLDVTVEDFNAVALFQGSISWDENVLSFTGVQGFNPNVPNLSSAFETPATNVLTFSWFDLNNFQTITLADGEVLFQLCFDVVGPLGSSSPVVFSSDPTPLEAGNAQGDDIFELGFIVRNGQVNVSDEALFVDIKSTDITCSGEQDGSFTVTVAEGTLPYRITWRQLPAGTPSSPVTIPEEGGMFSQDNLAGGQYEISIEDSTNPVNSTIDTVTIVQPPALGVAHISVLPSCFGESDGSITAEVSLDGVIQSDITGFTFNWNTGAGNVQTLTGIPSGFYAVTVTDTSGCQASASTTIGQPAPISISNNGGPNVSIDDASCSGVADGSITITPTGGTSASGDYTFDWDSGQGSSTGPSSTVTLLLPGEYSLTVTDDNGCQAFNSFIVGAEKTLIIDAVIDSVTCYDGADGEIFITGTTTGAPADLPYTFTWDGDFDTIPDPAQGLDSRVDSLAAGTYSLTMTDVTGCEVTESFELLNPDSITIQQIAGTPTSSCPATDGAATVAVSGGTYPYTYAWIDTLDNTVSTDSLVSNVGSQIFNFQVTDNNGCIDSLEVPIGSPLPPQLQPLANDTLPCFDDTEGSLTVVASPGDSPITGYRWSNGATGTTASALSPGVYYVTVSDQLQCASVDSALVIAPSPLVLDSIVAVSPSCAGESDGSLTAFATGGTMPYTYVWTNGGQRDTLRFNLYPGLSAGTYDLNIIDGNNCSSLNGTGIVNEPPAIAVTFSDTLAVSCFDNVCDGQAIANAQYADGSAGLFTFSWESGEAASGVASSLALQLCAGLQTVTVTDANQCFSVDTVDIPSPPAINILVDVEPITCNGESDGTITLNISGGTPNYDVLWTDSGATGPTLSGLPADTYNALVTDSRGCRKAQMVELSEPAALVLALDSMLTMNPRCSGDSNGVFAVSYNAGDDINPLPAAPYSWSGGIGSPDSPVADNLSSGTYSVTITDVKGCRDSLNYTLNEPPPIVAIIPQPNNPRCFGEPTLIIIDTIYGGNGTDLFDYTYMVDNTGISFTPDQAASVFAGERLITVEDPEGCTYEQSLTIIEPAELNVEFTPDVIEVNLGDSLQRLNPIITSSLPIDSFIWSPTTYLEPPTVQRPILNQPLESILYTLRIVDVNGCDGSGSILVDVDKSRNVYIPNVFSPNGDGPNDEFRIFACDGVRAINYARIFDRWGTMVHQTQNLLPDCSGTLVWDGRQGSQEMNPGVFVFVIEVEFIDNVRLVYRGDVTLLK